MKILLYNIRDYTIQSLKARGRKLSKDWIEKGRQGRLKYYKSHPAPNRGKPHTTETRRNISEAMKIWWQRRNNNRRNGGKEELNQ